MYESASERWSPVQSVEKVLLSVISMLAGKQGAFLEFYTKLASQNLIWSRELT